MTLNHWPPPCADRIGLVHAFPEVTDRRIEWSLLCAIEEIDAQIDALADASSRLQT